MTDPLFTTKPVKIDTLGEYLQQIRNKLNMDIKTVSMLTQIKPVYLENLEAGNWHKMPAEVYVRGFLKSLAHLYQISEEVLIEQYEKEHGFEPKAPTVLKEESNSIVRFTPKTIIVTATLAVSLLAVGYVASQIRSVLIPPMLEVSDPSGDINVIGTTVVVSGQAEVGSDVTINNQSVLTDQNGQFNETLILSTGLNVVEIAAKNKFNKVSKITRNIHAEVPQSAPVAEKLPVSITLEIGPGSAWIYLEVDGVVVQRGTMLPGSTKTVSGESDILLTSADAGSTKVIYNGKDLGKLGRPGEVIRNVEFSATTQE